MVPGTSSVPPELTEVDGYMMTAQPLVSVVMPSLNQAMFIELAVCSVLEQAYKPLELVVIDGGSTDGTLECLEALMGKFGSRLRWISEGDSGPANAINKALSLVSGQIIGWLNSDDLYASGAIAAAVGYLLENPDDVMVYGEGEHIDVRGEPLGRYPTRPPSATIRSFHDGCFICQPTVFLRRSVFDAVGALDESIFTAFDFELWLRIFCKYPGRIAHIERVQAYSRLHISCITQRMRKLVAVEGIKVLAKHVGRPKAHWLLTYMEEALVAYPFTRGIEDIKVHFAELIEEVKEYFDSETVALLYRQLSLDSRLQIAPRGVLATIYPDGWASPVLTVRIRKLAPYNSSIKLLCEHVSPVDAPLKLHIVTSWGMEGQLVVRERGEFQIAVDCSGLTVTENLIVHIASESHFIPRAVDTRSSDERKLSFRVRALQLTGSSWDM